MQSLTVEMTDVDLDWLRHNEGEAKSIIEALRDKITARTGHRPIFYLECQVKLTHDGVMDLEMSSSDTWPVLYELVDCLQRNFRKNHISHHLSHNYKLLVENVRSACNAFYKHMREAIGAPIAIKNWTKTMFTFNLALNDAFYSKTHDDVCVSILRDKKLAIFEAMRLLMYLLVFNTYKSIEQKLNAKSTTNTTTKAKRMLF